MHFMNQRPAVEPRAVIFAIFLTPLSLCLARVSGQPQPRLREFEQGVRNPMAQRPGLCAAPQLLADVEKLPDFTVIGAARWAWQIGFVKGLFNSAITACQSPAAGR